MEIWLSAEEKDASAVVPNPILASATQKWWIEKQGGQNEDAIMERGVL
jgi:hypothetical protein